MLGLLGRVPNLGLRAALPQEAAAFAVYQFWHCWQELMHVHSKALVLQQPLLVQFVVGQSVMSDLG